MKNPAVPPPNASTSRIHPSGKFRLGTCAIDRDATGRRLPLCRTGIGVLDLGVIGRGLEPLAREAIDPKSWAGGSGAVVCAAMPAWEMVDDRRRVLNG